MNKDVRDRLKILAWISVGIATALILHLRNTPERRYMRCYNKTKSLEQCVPIYMEKWSE